jgi:hypothetical protein
MSDAVWVRGYYGEQWVLVDGTVILEMHTEAETRRSSSARRRSTQSTRARFRDFEGAGSSREDLLAVCAHPIRSRCELQGNRTRVT